MKATEKFFKDMIFKDMIGKIISVDWRDSTLYITQCNKDDDFEITTITSIGKLIDCTDTMLVIAGDILGDDLRRVITIPLENVIGLSE